mmetsp:Transcript_3085/g.7248  ORF Transcript_3085/g.7248 Transcript_3085/m.7248 type:complete len:421 (-) Transcript_3085:237-1499(-)
MSHSGSFATFVVGDHKLAYTLDNLEREIAFRVKDMGLTSPFLKTLRAYLDCRDQMDAKYTEVDELHSIAKLQVNENSNGIHVVDNEYKSEFQQQTVDGEPVKNVDELYAAATIVEPIYREMIEGIVKQVQDFLPEQKDGIHVEFAPLKGTERASEKANDDYAQRLPRTGVSWLYDIVRGSICCDHSEQVTKCLELIQKDPRIFIVKAKNRFLKPTLTGYRDFNLAFQIETPEGFKHICEIQIHHGATKALSKELDSHKHYEYFRTFFQGDTSDLETHLADLKAIDSGMRTQGDLFGTRGGMFGQSKADMRLERMGELFLNGRVREYYFAAHVYFQLLRLRLEGSRRGQPMYLVGDAYHKLAVSLGLVGRRMEASRIYKKAEEIIKDPKSRAPMQGNMRMWMSSKGFLTVCHHHFVPIPFF